jgi:hypothetical protein
MDIIDDFSTAVICMCKACATAILDGMKFLRDTFGPYITASYSTCYKWVDERMDEFNPVRVVHRTNENLMRPRDEINDVRTEINNNVRVCDCPECL